MPTQTEVESSLIERSQTSVPASVRGALHLGKYDNIRYSICTGGKLVLSRAKILRLPTRR